MLLETAKLMGTRFNRVGVQSRIINAGPFEEGFQQQKDLPYQFGSYAGVHGCANRVGFLTGFAVNWRSPTLCFDFKWLNREKHSWFISEFYVSMAFMAVFTSNLRKTSSQEDEAQIPVKQWPGLKNVAGFARWVT